MNRLLLLVTLIVSTLPIAAQAIETQTSGKAYCYSAYHLRQQLELTVNFGESIQRQATKVDVDIHVREIPTSIKNLPRINAQISAGKNKNIPSRVWPMQWTNNSPVFATHSCCSRSVDNLDSF